MLGAGLLFAGHETTVTAIDGGALRLLTNPDQRAALAADPDLLDPAVDCAAGVELRRRCRSRRVVQQEGRSAEGRRRCDYGSCSAASRSSPARHISSSPATTSSMIVSISAYGGWKLAATSPGRSRPNSMVYG